MTCGPQRRRRNLKTWVRILELAFLTKPTHYIFSFVVFFVTTLLPPSFHYRCIVPLLLHHSTITASSRNYFTFPGGAINPQYLPYNMLADKEKKENRERAQELLRYMQMVGYRVIKWVPHFILANAFSTISSP